MKFEPGQKVVCVDNVCVSTYLTQGKVYTVKEYDARYKTVRLENHDDNLKFPAMFAAERFQLSEVMPLEDML